MRYIDSLSEMYPDDFDTFRQLCNDYCDCKTMRKKTNHPERQMAGRDNLRNHAERHAEIRAITKEGRLRYRSLPSNHL